MATCEIDLRTVTSTLLTPNLVAFTFSSLVIPADGYVEWIFHDDVIKWKHLPRYWPFVRGIHWSPVNSPHKGQWRGALMFSLICIWINGWVNSGEAGDLRRYRAHYDVSVMCRTDTSVARLLHSSSQGLYSLSGKTSYRQISWSLEATRLGVINIAPLLNLTGTSAALLPMGLSNFRAIGKV